MDSATVGGDSKGIKGLLIGEVMMILDSLYTHESIIYIHTCVGVHFCPYI